MTPRQELALEIIKQNQNGVSAEVLSRVWVTPQARRENLSMMVRAKLIIHDPETWCWRAKV